MTEQDLIASLNEFIKKQDDELKIDTFYLTKDHEWINGAIATRFNMLQQLRSILEAVEADSFKPIDFMPR